MGSPSTKSSNARQRLVETAERLFYAEGVRAVGIDRIIAEAGVAKTSLYNHFSSKDDLILAVLQYREEKFDAMFAQWMKRHADQGLTPLDAFFAALKDWFESPGFRGCMFINAFAELATPDHEAAKFAVKHKQRFHEMIKNLIAESAGAKSAESWSNSIALLVEGAIVTAVMSQSSKSADVARDAAHSLLAKKERNS